MAIIDDVEEHVRRVGPVREVADLIDDQDGGMGVRSQGVGEAGLRSTGLLIALVFAALGDRDQALH